MVWRLLMSLAQKSSFSLSAELCGCSLLYRAAVGAGFVLALKTQGQPLFQAQDVACSRCALLLYNELLLWCTVVKTSSELLSCSPARCGSQLRIHTLQCYAPCPPAHRLPGVGSMGNQPRQELLVSSGQRPCLGGDTYRALWLISFQISIFRGGFVLTLT